MIQDMLSCFSSLEAKDAEKFDFQPYSSKLIRSYLSRQMGVAVKMYG